MHRGHHTLCQYRTSHSEGAGSYGIVPALQTQYRARRQIAELGLTRTPIGPTDCWRSEQVRMPKTSFPPPGIARYATSIPDNS
eukprot:3853717-Rhodomonas_salina.3